MKDQRKTEIKVGLTVLLATIIFLWILGWAKNISLRAVEQVVQVEFQNVSGLERGDVVTVNGMRKGYVKDMRVEQNKIIVELSIDNDVQLKDDATFGITMLDLMGGKKVDVFPGASDKKLDLNKTYKGQYYADISSAMSFLGNLQGDIVQIMKEIQTSLSAMNSYLTDKSMERNIKSSLSNMNDITQKLNKLVEENRDNVNIISQNVAELSSKSNKFLTENQEKMTLIVDDLKNISTETNTLLKEINRITQETVNKENNLGKLMYDESIMTNLKQTLNQVNKLTEILIFQLQNDGVNVDANIF